MPATSWSTTPSGRPSSASSQPAHNTHTSPASAMAVRISINLPIPAGPWIETHPWAAHPGLPQRLTQQSHLLHSTQKRHTYSL